MVSHISPLQHQVRLHLSTPHFGSKRPKRRLLTTAVVGTALALGAIHVSNQAFKGSWHIENVYMKPTSTPEKPRMEALMHFTNKHHRPEQGTPVVNVDIKFFLKRFSPVTPEQPLADLETLEARSKGILAQYVKTQIAPHMEKSLDIVIAQQGGATSEVAWNWQVLENALLNGQGKNGVQVGKDWGSLYMAVDPSERPLLDTFEMDGVHYGIQMESMTFQRYMSPDQSELRKFINWLRACLP